MGERPVVPSAPELVVESDGGSQTMTPSRVYQVGRDPECDIVLHDARVSWHHAVLRPVADHWTVEDAGSTNGTWAEGRRVQLLDVGPGTVLRFGSPADGPAAVLKSAPPPAPPPPPPPASLGERPTSVSLPASTGTFRQPTSVRPLPSRTIRIGRGPDNEVTVDDLVVSRRHAELRAGPGGDYEIVDLGSHNGTFLNGHPVRRAPVLPGDIIGIGHSAFCLVGDQLQEYVDSGEISLDVQDLCVHVDAEHGRKRLLDRVSFPVEEKSLLAVVGPSGSGKSTLLNALTGLRPADEGAVLYDGRDLYRDYAELRARIGLVPQDDILHVQLTVRRALSYAAELRFPGDTAKAERLARVEEVIGELGLEQRADQPIHSLSGGQRKRVSVALELLTKPSLLFLDEPTSGLDPGMDRSVMNTLRTLADDGRTVIVVTHSVLSLDVCDRLLVLAPGGRTAFYGPPGDTPGFFGFKEWPEAFEAFENDKDRDWPGEYRASPQYRQYVETAAAQPLPAEPPAAEAEPATAPPKPQSWGAQLSTLMRRYVRALSTDRTFLIIMIVLPFVTGAMARLSSGTRFASADKANTVLLILCVGGVLTGAANAVRELVKERVIYRRERAVGLSRSAYVMSKIIVLGVITVAQAVVLSIVGLGGVDTRAPHGQGVLMPPLVEMTLALAVLSFTSMLLGLLVSAIVRREEVTMPLLVLITLVQVVFCGGMIELNNKLVLEQLSWLVPSRWALAAMSSTIDFTHIPPATGQLPPSAGGSDPLFRHAVGTWLMDMGMMLVLALVFALLVARLLRRHEPAVMRK
ncbi:ATP-binding cassette domain-containing protein [Streptomyces sp. VNUA116]|uniref:FHA domain-containing protein n=1 Tax=Streptomyces sp. VNUA116 TaxID=3062449 RepID=UPI00267590D7|nr:FHA domain-containing protein [Streptomyces sp. VNUA116]WKU48537.1 ATP-binding cassette domain-containing protein [Streptomyces sp. VNUA116]